MDILSSCYLFKGLSSHQIDYLATSSHEKSIVKGEWLFHEGDAADRLYLLVDGAVELLTTIENDIELPTARLRKSGDCFGTSALVEPFQYSLSARCTDAADLMSIGKDELSELLQKDCDLGRIVMSNLSEHYLDRLREARQELKIHFKILLKVMRF